MTNQISISRGNSKMGAIPSISLPACTTCNPDAPCFRQCYARRLSARRASVRDAYARNLEILQRDPAAYWLQLRAAAVTVRYFRFHVSGDIPNADYFLEMINTARALPGTVFLAFTKQYQIVNDYLDAGGDIPSNLKIIFSNWGIWKCQNPYGLPVCEIVFRWQQPAPAWKICGGNCTACACAGIGCWELKRGETIAIYQH